MNLIDCKKIRAEMLEEAKQEIAKFNRKPKLVVIQVGSDPASNTYIRNKLKTCEEVGIECVHMKLSEEFSADDVENVIYDVIYDLSVTGVMLQLPLPDHLKPYQQELLDIIPWHMDVDGLATDSIGRLWSGQKCLAPCTAAGIMRLLLEDLSGKNVCVVGRSALVGKPLNKLLLDRNATVNVCHSKSGNLHQHVFSADIVITAIGKAKFFDSDYINYYYDEFLHDFFTDKKQMWIDVGINRDENDKLCGDIDISAFEDTHCSITPVPGGIGTLTTAQLVLNVIQAYKMQNEG